MSVEAAGIGSRSEETVLTVKVPVKVRRDAAAGAFVAECGMLGLSARGPSRLDALTALRRAVDELVRQHTR